jgi:flagellar basal body rod protein FlgG
MIDGLYSAYAGLVANGKKINASAHDIARMETGGLKKNSPVAEAETAAVTTVNVSSPDVEETAIQPVDAAIAPEASDIDLAEAMVELTVSQRGFEANLASFRTQDETLGTFLDIMA